jgi:glycosyltransferase involved in cell wall biosynthesis
MKILIIIPAYNEEDSILDTVSGVKKLHPEADVLVINDCSRDRTEEILTENGIRHVRLPVNLGIGGAMQCGYRYACLREYDVAVQMDGDGQHPAEELDSLLAPVLDGSADMSIGSRFIKGEGFQSSAMRRTGIRFLSFLIRLRTGQRILDVTSGYRAVNLRYAALFSREYAQDYPEPESLVLAARAGARIAEVPVQMRQRQGGVSSISFLRSIYYMIKVSLAILTCSTPRS